MISNEDKLQEILKSRGIDMADVADLIKEADIPEAKAMVFFKLRMRNT